MVTTTVRGPVSFSGSGLVIGRVTPDRPHATTAHRAATTAPRTRAGRPSRPCGRPADPRIMGKRSSVAPSRTGSRVPLVVGVVVVAVLAVVIGGVILSRAGTGSSSGSDDAVGAIPVQRAAVQYPAQVDGDVVVAGRPADHTLDVYEDALCPACRQFETRGAARLAKAVAAGNLQIRYHLVNLLDQRSQPTGYSSLAGNAMMCGADNGIFPDLHTSLYLAQPQEGGTAWTADQLVDLGRRLGAGPGYESCVRGGTHTAAMADNLARAAKDPDLVRDGAAGFGTPALVLDDKLVQNDDERLDRIAPA